MKEASGELSMTLVVIIAAGVIIGIFAAFWPQINNTITRLWGGFENKAAGKGMIVNRNIVDIPGYTIDLGK